MKLLKITFLLSLFLLPLGELLRISVTNDVVIKPLEISIGCSALLIIILITRKKSIESIFFIKPLIFFVVIAILSLLMGGYFLTGTQLAVSGLYLLRWIAFATISIIVASFDKRFKKTISNILLIIGVIIIFFGYVQFFLYPNLRNLYYLGWDEHNYRMFSVFLDPNFAGAYFVLFFLFIVGLIQSNLKTKKQKNIRLLIALSVFTVVAIFLTYSRSAILMLIVASVTYLIFLGKKKLLGVPFGLVILILVLLSPTFNKENTNPLRITSSMARIDSYGKAINIIKTHPLFGVGFNAYRYAEKPSNQAIYPNHAEAGTDSSLLFVTATTGFVGLAAYLYLWFSILKKAIYLYRNESNTVALVIVCSTVGLFVNSIFINSLFFPAIMLWMWILIGMMDD